MKKWQVSFITCKELHYDSCVGRTLHKIFLSDGPKAAKIPYFVLSLGKRKKGTISEKLCLIKLGRGTIPTRGSKLFLQDL
jgi:hypothetical protein